jgi:phospholipid/cholesterol/gamma-HCH transport system substrate-binding protein
MTMPAKLNKPHTPRYKLEGAVLLLASVLTVALVYKQFQGDFTPKVQLTVLSSRAGLAIDPGSKVTYNGVAIGRVAHISGVQQDGKPAANLVLDVNSKFISMIPANANVDIKATTAFGNKYLSFTSPKSPSPQRIPLHHVIDARSVTTEFNTLFETITSIAEKVDPVKVNLTLSATAEALAGLGDKFGQSIVKGNAILDDINPQMPAIRHDVARLADLSDIYAKAAPDLFDALNNVATTFRTLNAQKRDLDAALLASAGFGNTGANIFERGGPYLSRAAADLVPTAKLLDTYSPELYCTIHNYAELVPKLGAIEAGNGYAAKVTGQFLGAENPYVYPDNLPRANAKGGPGGAPGCWQTITRNLWPAPYLVMDTGASIAPYNHFEIGQPLFTDYVWGRQYGENTINP